MCKICMAKQIRGKLQIVRGTGRLLVIDSRTFSEYNASHVQGAINVCCSKLVKRRLQQDKVSVTELLQPNSKVKVELGRKQEVVVYDQSSKEAGHLSKDGFVHILMGKLEGTFHKVSLLTGGFAAFSSCFPGLCEGKPATALPMSLSQPCLPVANVGPTRILPHLYLGSQKDVLNKDLMAQNGITYVLNASNTCPKPDFISESHFMRIPVNDNYCEKLLPWLDKTNEFIDKAKVSNCRVIVHCLAGISRSATIAIAYIMKTMGLSSDDAYRFVKDRRPSISPNFNFLGQLLEFEKELRLLQPQIPSEPKLPSPTTLQQGFNGLHLSAERIMDTNRLKRSFSLDIKSVYSPNSSHCPTLAPSHCEDVPKLCKLDSPGSGTSNGICSQSPVQDSPSSSDSPFPSPGIEGGDMDLGVNGTAEESTLRLGSSSAYVAFGCSEGARLRDKSQRDKPPTGQSQRDHRDSMSNGAANSGSDKQFNRRSCQMEFEDGISETRSREELGKIGKQSSFSGSMEIIEVS
uniref:Dual specificity protein phosphatase 8 n=1 Tax=Neogobius melanostomus TaxID=47308 RepID=A0A8C6UGV1_9GOBI